VDNCKILLTKERINVLEALAFVNSPYCGGTSIFIGTTRNTESGNDAKQVSHLIYEAYEDMALTVMDNIVGSLVRDAKGLHKVYVCHRIGQVDIGQESILIAVSSPHRSSCHQMVMQILNEIKRKTPIWKKVCFAHEEDSLSDWSSNSEAFWLEKNDSK